MAKGAEIVAKIQTILAMPPEEVAKSSLLETVPNLPTVVSALRRVVERLNVVAWDEVPGGQRRLVNEQLAQIEQRCNVLRKASPVNDQEIRQLEAQLAENYDKLWELSVPALLMTVGDREAEYRKLIAEIWSERAAQKQEGEKLLHNMRQTSQELAQVAEAKRFLEESNKHWWAAMVWLAVAACIATAFVVGAVWLWENPTPPDTYGYATLAQKIAAKLLIVSVATTALIVALRNYSANRHNFVVNRHRANALHTFQAFAASTTDAKTKNRILTQVTQAVFASRATGYLKDSSDNGSVNVSELVKLVVPPK